MAASKPSKKLRQGKNFARVKPLTEIVIVKTADRASASWRNTSGESRCLRLPLRAAWAPLQLSSFDTASRFRAAPGTSGMPLT
jgi:hypothetical protein